MYVSANYVKYKIVISFFLDKNTLTTSLWK